MKKIIKPIIELLVVVILTVVVFKFIAIPVRIDGSSMESGLSDGDIGLMNGLSLSESEINRFDIVVINCEALDEKIIKRVIGLPGELVTFKDDQLYINGTLYQQDFLDESFVSESLSIYGVQHFTENFSIQLKEGEFFVMGDNRLRSTDSRELGPFNIKDFIGRKGFVLFPFNHIQEMK